MNEPLLWARIPEMTASAEEFFMLRHSASAHELDTAEGSKQFNESSLDLNSSLDMDSPRTANFEDTAFDLDTSEDNDTSLNLDISVKDEDYTERLQASAGSCEVYKEKRNHAYSDNELDSLSSNQRECISSRNSDDGDVTVQKDNRNRAFSENHIDKNRLAIPDSKERISSSLATQSDPDICDVPSPAMRKRKQFQKRLAPKPPLIVSSSQGSTDCEMDKKPVAALTSTRIANSNGGHDPVLERSPKNRIKLLAKKIPHLMPHSPKEKLARKNSKKVKRTADRSVVYTDDDFAVVAIGDDLVKDIEFEIQRIADYEKCLTELLDQTPSDHPDYDDLFKAADRVKEIAKAREADLVQAENEQMMEQVQEKFPNDDLDLDDNDNKHLKVKLSTIRRKSAPGAILFRNLSSSKFRHSGNLSGNKYNDMCQTARLSNKTNRLYICESSVQITTGLQTSDRYLFLFTDLLLIAKAKSSTNFKLKHRVRVSEMWLASCIDDIAEVSQPETNSFVIGWPSTNVVVTFSTPELKQMWLSKLQHCMNEEKQKEQPKEVNIKVNNKDLGEMRTIAVSHMQTTSEVIDLCMQKSQILKNDTKDYQLWVSSGKEESAYPLIGHEIPFSIQMSHIRDIIRFRGLENVIPEEFPQLVSEAPRELKCEFFLKNSKKAKKHELGDDAQHTKNKKAKRSPLLNIFKRHISREEKTLSPLSVAMPGKLYGRRLDEVATEDGLPPKQILDLLMLLFLHGPFTPGILRKGANEKMKRELRQKLDDGEECLDDETPPLIIGTLLKDYLRSLPESLLDSNTYNDWLASGDISDYSERITAVKQLVSRLAPCNNSLLRYLMCVLYHIAKRSEDNNMNSFNLSVCIGQSILWSAEAVDTEQVNRGNDVVNFVIDNCEEIFGEDVTQLLGEAPDRKFRQDSGTDSDSMHSVLSVPDNGLSRRDDSSIDSLDRVLYTNEPDTSPHLPNSHLSPSNLSRDSGLTLSDSQLYADDGAEGDACNGYSRCMNTFDRSKPGTMPFNSSYLASQSASSLSANVPRARKKPFIPLASSEGNSAKPQGLSQSLNSDILRQMRNNHQTVSKRVSAESLQSVNEASELDTTTQQVGPATNIFFEEASSRNLDCYKYDKFFRQKSVADSTPPLSPHSKISYSSDSLLSDSSISRGSLECGLSTPPRSPHNGAAKRPAWLPSERDNQLLSLDLLTSTDDFAQSHSRSRDPHARYVTKSMDDLQTYISPPSSPDIHSHHSSATDVTVTPSHRHSIKSCVRETRPKSHNSSEPSHHIPHKQSPILSREKKNELFTNQHRKSTLDSSSSPTIILHTTSSDENSVKSTFYSPSDDEPLPHVDIVTETNHINLLTENNNALPYMRLTKNLTESQHHVDRFVDDVDCNLTDLSSYTQAQTENDLNSCEKIPHQKGMPDDINVNKNGSSEYNIVYNHKNNVTNIEINHSSEQTEKCADQSDGSSNSNAIVNAAKPVEIERNQPEVKMVAVIRKECTVTTVRVPKKKNEKRNVNEDNSNNNNNNCNDSNSDNQEKKVSATIIPLSVPMNPPVSTPPVRTYQSPLSSVYKTSQPLLSVHRPLEPPSYDEALNRKYKIKHGIPLNDVMNDVITDEQCDEQRAVSERARRIYEDSVKRFQEDCSRRDETSKVSENNSTRVQVKLNNPNYVKTRLQQFCQHQKEQESKEENDRQTLSQSHKLHGHKALSPRTSLEVPRSCKCGDSANVAPVQRSRSNAMDHAKQLKPTTKDVYPLRDTRLLEERRRMQQAIHEKNKRLSIDGDQSLEEKLLSIDNSRGATSTNLPWSVSKLRGLYSKEQAGESTVAPRSRPAQPPPYVSPPMYKHSTNNRSKSTQNLSDDATSNRNATITHTFLHNFNDDEEELMV